MLEEFYHKVETSKIVWINQPEPKGFGDAVAHAEPFIGNEPFIVHAGDTIIFSKNYLQKLITAFTREETGATLLAREVENPKIYGVIEPAKQENNIIHVKRIIEKPEKPPTNLAVVPVYIFDPIIFKALKLTKPSPKREIELTNAIQKLIDWGLKVTAVKLNKSEERIDIGTPETYWQALKITYKLTQTT